MKEVICALSLATDLANGQPFEKTLRTCLVATHLARHLGLSLEARTAVCHTALLRFLGCTAFAYEEAAFAGDDLQFRSDFLAADVRDTLFAIKTLAKSEALGPRVRALSISMTRGRSMRNALAESQCEAAQILASRLFMSEQVVSALGDIHERWDGFGSPRQKEGDGCAIEARIVTVAHVFETAFRAGGLEYAIETINKRLGSHIDPAIARLAIRISSTLAEQLKASSVWFEVMQLDEFSMPVTNLTLDDVANVLGDFAALLCPMKLGHAAAVSKLAAGTAAMMGVSREMQLAIARAGRMLDLGAVCVPAQIWSKPGPLTPSESQRVRLHPHYSREILQHASALQIESRLVETHHERSNRSGYPKTLSGAELTVEAKILAVAEVYAAMIAPRAYRAPLRRTSACDALHSMTRTGEFDVVVVDAIIGAAEGRQVTSMVGGNDALSSREVQVLIGVAQGLTNKELALQLGITPRTVGHHLENIYSKLNVRTRTAAALYAMKHGLTQE